MMLSTSIRYAAIVGSLVVATACGAPTTGNPSPVVSSHDNAVTATQPGTQRGTQPGAASSGSIPVAPVAPTVTVALTATSIAPNPPVMTAPTSDADAPANPRPTATTAPVLPEPGPNPASVVPSPATAGCDVASRPPTGCPPP